MIRIPQAQSSLRIRQRQICRPLSRLPQTVALALLPTLLAACQPRPAEEASPTEVRSDGRFRWTLTRLENVWPTQQFDWLDDETILLIGVDKANRSGLFAWDHKGKARLILPGAYRLCFDGETWRALVSNPDPKSQKKSYTRYRINPSDLSTTRIGPMAKPPGGSLTNFYTCDEESHSKEPKGRLWTPLLPGDGHLEFGSNWKHPEETTLVRPESKERIALGFIVPDPTKAEAHYSRFGGTYIIYDAGFTTLDLKLWNESGKLTVYTLTAPNRIRSIAIRPGPWSKTTAGDRSIRVARNGIITSSKGRPRSGRSTEGIYLLQPDNTFSKLDNGSIESPVISPNGCRLAYRRASDNSPELLISARLC